MVVEEAATVQQLIVYNGLDYPGVHQIIEYTGTTLGACINSCLAEPKCAAFKMTQSLNVCRLMTAAKPSVTARPNSAVISFELTNTKTTTKDLCAKYAGFDAPTADLIPAIEVRDPSVCQLRCLMMANCAGFVLGMEGKLCILKGRIDRAKLVFSVSRDLFICNRGFISSVTQEPATNPVVNLLKSQASPSISFCFRQCLVNFRCTSFAFDSNYQCLLRFKSDMPISSPIAASTASTSTTSFYHLTDTWAPTVAPNCTKRESTTFANNAQVTKIITFSIAKDMTQCEFMCTRASFCDAYDINVKESTCTLYKFLTDPGTLVKPATEPTMTAATGIDTYICGYSSFNSNFKRGRVILCNDSKYYLVAGSALQQYESVYGAGAIEINYRSLKRQDCSNLRVGELIKDKLPGKPKIPPPISFPDTAV